MEAELSTCKAPLIDVTAPLSTHERISDDVFLLTFDAPELAACLKPGQFVQVDIDSDLTLRRPFSVYACHNGRVSIYYRVVGHGTQLLAAKSAGQPIRVMGPLGRPWESVRNKRALLVGGGLGAAPLGMLVDDLHAHNSQVIMVQGGRDISTLVARDSFADRVDEHHIVTDDGSCGEEGMITLPITRLLADEHFDVAYLCGPEVMQRAVAQLTTAAGIKTYVSLERAMACGLGACLSCVVPTTMGLKRACTEGPVFDAEEVLWDEASASRCL